MVAIRTVLCPVNFSAATARQVDLAAELCRAFGAKLVVQHNVVELALGAGVGWMWSVDHQNFRRRAEQNLRDVVARVREGLSVEGRLTQGPIAQAVIAVGEAVGADLVVLCTRGAAAAEDEDGSLTERALERAVLPILAIHEATSDHHTPRFTSTGTSRQPLLVPIDLTPASRPALDLALDLSRRFPFHVHLLHVRQERGGPAGTDADDHVRREMMAAVPQDLTDAPDVHVERGDPAHVIADVADRLSAACVVMGEHARTPLRHWFRRDVASGVLHQAPCPIWYVPGARGRA